MYQETIFISPCDNLHHLRLTEKEHPLTLYVFRFCFAAASKMHYLLPRLHTLPPLALSISLPRLSLCDHSLIMQCDLL